MAYQLGTSDNGKIIEAYMQPKRSLYRIRFVGGGSIPKVLAGEYTNVGAAQKDVDVYLETKRLQKLGKASKVSE